ncbi:Glycosylphosphatidylinositol:protein transamidase, GAA1 component [Sarocladium strictum]
MLKLPPYLSLLCIIIGTVWLFLLPLDDYSRKTYISENALLPGQVHTYFGGSERNIFRAFRHEVDALVEKDDYRRNDELEKLLKGVGLKVGRQNYTYVSAGEEYAGENVYGILQAPRGDATEAIVLVAAWKSIDGRHNSNGVGLALTLARYFKRWSLWSKDIILVIPPDSTTGTQAWVDAYHDAHNPQHVAALPIKSGALQGAVAIDHPMSGRFESVHIVYDGTNGQLPNLDLINSIVNIARNQMGISTFLQNMSKHSNKYEDRLRTMLRGMLNQGIGAAAGPHSSFIPYHVDAVTLQPFGQGWHEEMALGRLVEGSFRSLNNLLEHLHQSFFFYLLMDKDRFVSIGTYLPSAMLLAANFSIMAIFLWVKSGQSSAPPKGSATAEKVAKGKLNDNSSTDPSSATGERDLIMPLGVVATCFGMSAVPLSMFNHIPSSMLGAAFTVFAVASAGIPFIISHLLSKFYKPTTQHFQLTKSFSLLFLGMTLSTLATLNFSLAFIVGLLASPLTFVQPTKNLALRFALAGLLTAVAPTTVIFTAAQYAGMDVTEVLRQAAFGWNVWGMYTPIVLWCVWWPAWLVGMVNVLGVTAA